MGEFFQGWRRKTGVATLVMALLLLGAWAQSQISSRQIADWYDGRTWNRIILGDTGVSYEQTQHIPGVCGRELVNEFVIPYWPVIMPLTSLSAFLLLTNPRHSIQTKIIEPVPESGA